MKWLIIIEVYRLHEVKHSHRSVRSTWSELVPLKYHNRMKWLDIIEVP